MRASLSLSSVSAGAREQHASDLPPLLPAWQRVLKGQTLMHYHRLGAAVVLANLAWAMLWLGPASLSGPALIESLASVTLVNFAVGIFARQQVVINALFALATSAPLSWPLGIRALLAKVYHYGGLHAGGAIAGTVWFCVLTFVIVTRELSSLTTGVSVALALLLVILCAVSRSRFRQRHHDAFEVTKRFGGWLALLLFWIQHLALTAELSPEASLVSWQAAVLLAITISVALPWLRLKKVPVHVVTPSTHVALAHFDHGVTPFAGSSTALSRNPLFEWHSFANIPSPGKTGFRLAIARAGDWTGRFVDDPPEHIWVKGIPTAGVANVERLFRKVLYVATGSGIGPCLPHLIAREVPAKLLWATRTPRDTFGGALVDEILASHPDAVVWDTASRGKPDMVALAAKMARECGAEAMICISNKKLTWNVVTGLESRGIPAYGAVWDS